MTRNNLEDHLAWLSQNVALSKPTAIQFPPARDPASLGFSQSSVETGSPGSQAEPISRPQRAQPGVDRVTTAPGTTNASIPSTHTCQVTTEEPIARVIEMGRLTSSSKPHRPSLVVAQPPLPTPTSTNGPRRLEQAYTSLLEQEAKGTRPRDTAVRQGNSSLSPTLREERKRSHLQANISMNDGYDSDFLDLTGHDDPFVSPSSLQFGTGDTAWAENHGSRAEPVPNSGKKRKSNDISKLTPSQDEDDFPEIDKLLESSQKQPPAHRRPAKPSKAPASVRRAATETAVIEQRTVTETVSRLERRVRRTSNTELVSSPTKQSNNQEKHQILGNEPCNDGWVSSQDSIKRRKISGNKLTTVVASGSDQSIMQTRRPGRRDVIQDSEDEFLTPPTHQSKSLVMSAGISREREDHISTHSAELQDVLMAVETPSRSRATAPDSVASANARNPEVSNDLSISVRKEPATQTPSNGLPPPTYGADPRILTLVLDTPGLAQAIRATIEEELAQNKADFQRSFREMWPKEDRDTLKRAKEPLIDRLRGVDELLDMLNSHQRLTLKRDALLKTVTEAYDEGLETEKEETQLDELSRRLQALEQSILLKLAEAGIREMSTVEKYQGSSHVNPTASVVCSTQFTSRTRSKQPTHQDSFSDVIHQTQLAPARVPSIAHDVSRRSIVVDENGLDLGSPFPRRPGPSSRTPKSVPQQPQRWDRGPSPDYGPPEFLSDDFVDVDNVTKPPNLVGQTSKQRIPLKPHRHTREDEYSDFDDEDLLAAVENYEQSFSEVPPKPRRNVFAETSGNTAPREKQASKKRELASAKPGIPPELMVHPWSSDVRRALKDRFRMTRFRTNQLEAINATLSGQDAFILMPTGGGKSLCYQLPAVISSGKTRGVTIVISPLISLMHDQVHHLKALNILAEGFNSEAKGSERNRIMNALQERNPEHFVQLLYVTPEMVNKSQAFQNGMLSLFRNKKLARIVIDEAHCVSQWGHDFRPDYKELDKVRGQFPGVPVMALTATATQNVIMDIKHTLGMNRCQVFSQSFNRDNLFYDIRKKEKGIFDTVAELIKGKYEGKTGIIYTLSRKTAEQVAAKLSAFGVAAEHYHANLGAKEKSETQIRWQRGQTKVVVATIAFGMGIDKPDVRFVIHYALPKSLEGYYQETGRAGRDGKPSDCILFYGRGDVTTLKKLINDGDGKRQQKERQLDMLNRVVAFCENRSECRRSSILRYFGETFGKADCNRNCDNCQSNLTFENRDVSEYAVAALQLISRNERLPIGQLTDHLMGRRRHGDSEDLFGVAKKLQKHEVHQIIDKLAADGAIGEINVMNRSAGFAQQYLVVSSFWILRQLSMLMGRSLLGTRKRSSRVEER
jgi:bloom syndrome protein